MKKFSVYVSGAGVFEVKAECFEVTPLGQGEESGLVFTAAGVIVAAFPFSKVNAVFESTSAEKL